MALSFDEADGIIVTCGIVTYSMRLNI